MVSENWLFAMFISAIVLDIPIGNVPVSIDTSLRLAQFDQMDSGKLPVKALFDAIIVSKLLHFDKLIGKPVK